MTMTSDSTRPDSASQAGPVSSADSTSTVSSADPRAGT